MLKWISLFSVFLLLLLGGQGVMETVHAQRIMADLRGVSVALLLYRDRHGFLPGDDPHAHARFQGLGFGESGNGDGRIEGAWNSERLTDESRLVWLHLRMAGLYGHCERPTASACRELAIGVGGARIGVQSAPVAGADWRSGAVVICVAPVSASAALRASNVGADGGAATGDLRVISSGDGGGVDVGLCQRVQ